MMEDVAPPGRTGTPTGAAPPPLVGRQEELATLRRLAAGARADGTLRLALVTGDAGMGKSHLLQALAASLDDPATVLTGECLDLGEATLPYAPLVQALREVLRDPDAHGVALDDPARAALSRLAPELGPPPARATGLEGQEVGHTQLYEHVLSLVERLAVHAGLLVLAIEDLHFSDASTRDLLWFLSQNISAAPLLLVVTARAEEISRRHPAHRLITAMRRSPKVTEVVLGPLGRVPMIQMLAATWGEDPDQTHVDEVVDRAAGNPFFALELAQAGHHVPEGLSDLLLARVDALGPDTQHLLRLAAAAGPLIEHETIRAVTGWTDDRITAALREAVDERVLEVTVEAAHRFRHALLQEVIHDLLLPGEARGLHAELARALTADGGLTGRHAARIARHHERSGDLAACLEASHAAAEAALAAVAYPQAQRHFERVADLWHDVPDAAERTGVDLAEVLKKAALCAISGYDEQRGIKLAQRAMAEVDLATDATRAALIQMWIGHGMSHAGLPHSVEAYRRAVELVGPDPSAERARVLGALAKGLMLLAAFAEAQGVAREAIAVAEEVGSSRDAAYSMITLGTIEMGIGAQEDGQRLLEEGLRVATEIGRVDYVLRGHVNLSDGLTNHGSLVEAVEVAQRGVALARAHGLLRSHGAMLQANMVDALVMLGRVEEALEVSEEAVALAADGLLGGHARLGRAEALLLGGRPDEAAAAVTEAYRQMREVEEPQYVMRLARVDGDVRQALGNHARAMEVGEAALAQLGPVEGNARYEAGLAALTLEAAARANRLTPDLLDRLQAAVDRAAARGELPVHRADRLHLAALRRTHGEGDAVSAWTAAAEAYEALGMAPCQVRCLLAAADAQLVGGDRTGAQEDWKRASRLAGDMGAIHLGMQAEVLGRRAGFLESAPQQDPYGLTSRELEVLQLVAAGLTNGQIGEELFITGKTASVHVSNLMAKMGVSTRGQAAAQAHRAGLVRDI